MLIVARAWPPPATGRSGRAARVPPDGDGPRLRTAARRRDRLPIVSHPSLGLPPIDRLSALPPAAARVAAERTRLADRALEVAIDRDPSLRERHDEYAMRALLRDAGTFVDLVVGAIAADDPGPARAFAEAAPPAYRRRKVAMNDLINLCESLRITIQATLPAADHGPVDAAIDAMIERFRWHGRIAGDARKRNRLIAAIYKGA